MKSTVIGLFVCLALSAGEAAAQSWQPPPDNQRCPSKWGAGDERGAANLMKPETVLRAARLIRAGEVIELGHVLSSAMPLSAGRRFDIDTKRTTMNPQSNRRGSNEELVIAEIGQVGTQFDGFAHQTLGNSLYNCFKVDETSTRTGFTKLGIQNVGALVTRGVLIDVAALKNVDMLPDSYEVSVQDLQQAMARQKVSLQAGDAVIIHTGWGKLWGKDNARYSRGNPGLGIAASEWLARQDPMLVGADTAAGRSLAESGSASLAADPSDHAGDQRHSPAGEPQTRRARRKGVYEFAFIVEPLKIQGGTGSTVAPIAIR